MAQLICGTDEISGKPHPAFSLEIPNALSRVNVKIKVVCVFVSLENITPAKFKNFKMADD